MNPVQRGLAVTSVVVIAVCAVIVALAAMNKSYTLSIDKDGKFSVAVAQGSNFRDVLVSMLSEDRDSVEEVLAGQNYYHFTDPALVNALETLSPDREAHQPIVDAMRRMLADQRGPFVMPDTLVGFDDRLVDAFDQLEAKLSETRQASELVIGLWRQSLEYRGIFRARNFAASVRRYPGLAGRSRVEIPLIYACPGSDFVGNEVMLIAPDTGNSISGIVVTARQHDCGGRFQSLADLFNSDQAELGLGEDAYQALYSPADPDAQLEPSMPAQVQFLANGTTTLTAALGQM